MTESVLGLWQSAGLFDAICIAVLLLSIVLGMVRGFVAELASLLAWVAAFFAARWAAPAVQIWFSASEFMRGWSAQAQYVLAFALVFVLVLLLISLVSGALRRSLQGLGLGAVDGFLGAGFGALRAMVLLWLLTVAVWSTPLHQGSWWVQSPAAGWLTASLQQLTPMLPVEVRSWLPPALGTKA
ncbi:MAG: CvpA family protein [Brachymonas denitrificans]|uniref:CvpA family protein n=1 Tax=Brachymonas denitrificans TaxID=28220 RepID=UPI001BCF834B|nr:CvpA family protein [Brachymonas denitrificans]